MSEATFKGWLQKAGLPNDAASLVAEQFGADYLSIQAAFRGQGASAKSKALAAVEVCRRAFGRIEEHAAIDTIENPQATMLLMQAAHLAGCTAFAGVAASVYGLDEAGKDFDRAFTQTIGIIWASAQREKVNGFDVETLTSAYQEQRALVASEAKRLAASKGFLTRWLG